MAAKNKKLTLKRRISMAVAAFLIVWAARLLMLTVRHITPNKDEFHEHMRGLPDTSMIFAGWHQRLFYFLFAYQKYGLKYLGPMAGLASVSGDGLLAARVARSFGFAKIVRGSSSRRGAPALLEMANLMKAGWLTGIVLDAPRGPIYVAKPGVITLGKLSGKPIIPFAWAASRYWQLKSWDKMIIPKPFCKIYALGGVKQAIYVPEDADKETLEALRQQLEQNLFDLQRICDDNVNK